MYGTTKKWTNYVHTLTQIAIFSLLFEDNKKKFQSKVERENFFYCTLAKHFTSNVGLFLSRQQCRTSTAEQQHTVGV